MRGDATHLLHELKQASHNNLRAGITKVTYYLPN